MVHSSQLDCLTITEIEIKKKKKRLRFNYGSKIRLLFFRWNSLLFILLRCVFAFHFSFIFCWLTIFTFFVSFAWLGLSSPLIFMDSTVFFCVNLYLETQQKLDSISRNFIRHFVFLHWAQLIYFFISVYILIVCFCCF